MIRRFIIYGLLGACGEVLWNGIGSMMRGDLKLTGWTSMWMILIYGLAIFLEPIHDRIRHLSFLIRGGVYTVLIFMVEFFSGFLLREILGVCPWNYVNKPLSFYGLITLTYTPVWFICGLIFEKIHDFFTRIEYIFKKY
ncbi:hypothetical protein RBU49_06515 [Clostridium sp. MB40-C1]|uniref:putative ABC transporter permease n=1 Tax=Clostridium sp. MB40-C1 TaxID=3070996 RepID=UPI0027DEBC8C|nr:hypothetical protein [Clostridium sp. MB40-C1]WMJ81895.1 hypothetical protein RBU49_06515 [Clostridium sp. MB40-C1]